MDREPRNKDSPAAMTTSNAPVLLFIKVVDFRTGAENI